MDAYLKYVVRHPIQTIVVVLLVTFVLGWRLPDLRFGTSIYDLTIEDLPQNDDYKKFKQEFGSEEIILVAAKSRNFFEPKAFEDLTRLSDKISGIKGVRRVISLPQVKRDIDLGSGKIGINDFEKIIELKGVGNYHFHQGV